MQFSLTKQYCLQMVGKVVQRYRQPFFQTSLCKAFMQRETWFWNVVDLQQS